MNDPYLALIDELKKRGIRAEFMRRDQLIMPRHVWVSWKGQWYISTWAPAVYPVPPGVAIGDVCQECVEASDGGPFYTIPERITSKYRLEPLENEEVDRLFPAMDEEEEE